MLDKDLASIQDARDLLRRAHEAQLQFAKASQAEVDRICDAIARAADDHAVELAELAVKESGLGRVESKTLKNRFIATRLHQAYRNLRSCDVINEDLSRGVIEIGSPMGIVAGIIPITNPTSTALFKILISLKSRNGIVLSPHPNGVRCISRSAEIARRAAEQAGAPKGLIQCMQRPTLEGTHELMRHPLTSVIVATGGPGVVKAAYSSGKPAFGVGPGNPPVYVHHTANLKHAAQSLVISQGFDWGTICSSEQSLVVEREIAAEFKQALTQQNAHFCSPQETLQLQQLIQLQSGALNTKIVGQSPSKIAKMANFSVPDDCTLLIAPEQGVGKNFPLSREKLAPILAWYECDSWENGCELCMELIHYDGSGHTMGIHCQDQAVIRHFGLEKPVSRIIVNGPTTQGSVGYSTDLLPSMTLGCGTTGGNITSDNVGPMHLMNIKRVAYPRAAFFAEQGLQLAPELGAPSASPSASSDRATSFQPGQGNSQRGRASSHSASSHGAATKNSDIDEMLEQAMRSGRRPPSRDLYKS